MSPTKARFVVAVALTVLALGCKKAASVFLDLPSEAEPAPETTAVPGPAKQRPARAALPQPDTTRPAIERVFDPDSALALLPKDHAGDVDWMAALRNGTIRPRTNLPDDQPVAVPRFSYDFYFKGFEAYFPHSAHVQWLNCETCHARIFRQRGEPVTMDAINKGELCGRCHGKVAFPATTCERCHTSLEMPAGRAKPELRGDLVFSRPDTAAGGAGGSAFPPARFPHWIHRIRYRCMACHPGLFETRAGTAKLTMSEMRKGQACGRCHDGQNAFNLLECERCHVPARQAPDFVP